MKKYLDLLKDFDRETRDRLEREERDAYEAFHTFSWPPRPTTVEEFDQCLAMFFCRHFEVTFGAKWDPEDVHEFMYREPLEAYYGPTWRTNCLDMALSGVGGGLNEVLKRLSFSLSHLYAERCINGCVKRFLDPLSFNEVDKLSKTYVKHWKPIIPPASHLRMWVQNEYSLSKVTFESVLKKHPYWVRQYERAFAQAKSGEVR